MGNPALINLPYEPTPFESGIAAADYALIHGQHGEGFRYWRADDIPGTNQNAKVYVEAELGGNGKGLFYTTVRNEMVEEFGMIPIGSTLFSCLPSVAEITESGKILRSEPRQARTAKAYVIRGSGSFDPLPRRFVSSIVVVNANGSTVNPSHYEAVSADSLDDADTGGIHWLSNAPAAGTRYFVLYKYNPLYICIGDNIRSEPIGSDGELLPQRVLLQEDKK